MWSARVETEWGNRFAGQQNNKRILCLISALIILREEHIAEERLPIHTLPDIHLRVGFEPTVLKFAVTFSNHCAIEMPSTEQWGSIKISSEYL